MPGNALNAPLSAILRLHAPATRFSNGFSDINGESVDHLDYLWKERRWPGYHHLSHALEAASATIKS